MKRFIEYVKTAFALLVALMACTDKAKAAEYATAEYMDSVEISLLTCSPHEELYSLYGHTALRMHDLHQGRQHDVVFNWGVFNFEKPHFVLRFVFGLTDYELEAIRYEDFCLYYRQWGSSITEQVLNLTSEEKLRLNAALAENIKPENKVYRYNFFYDNCSTRPRDIVERIIDGGVVYMPRQDYTPTFREMIHAKTRHHDWARFGNDMLLGVKADMKTNRKEQEFLPENLLYDFDYASIQASDGSRRPLIKERRQPVGAGVQLIVPDFVLSPTECATMLLVACMIVMAIEWKRNKCYKYWDMALMLLTGLAGCVLLLMVFSQHPATSLNLQLLLINPLHLFYIPAILRRRKSTYWTALPVMVVLFIIGRTLQVYADGMVILALCLLSRYCIHFINEK